MKIERLLSSFKLVLIICAIFIGVFTCVTTAEAGASGYCLERRDQAELRLKVESKGYVEVSTRIFIGLVTWKKRISAPDSFGSEEAEFGVRVLENLKGNGKEVLSIIGSEIFNDRKEFVKRAKEWFDWQVDAAAYGDMNQYFIRDGWAYPIGVEEKGKTDLYCAYRAPLFIGEKFLFTITEPYSPRIAEPILDEESIWFKEVKKILRSD